MRWVLPATLGLSLTAHVVVTAALMLPRGAPAAAESGDPDPVFAGETFELPAPDTTEVPLANASPSEDTTASADPEIGDAPARPRPPSHARPSARPSHEGRPSAGHADPGAAEGEAGGTASSGLFGAVGERSAADLATAFTRGFPQAASADPAWRNAALGPAGEAVVTLSIDDTGHLTDSNVSGSPSPALAAGIKRTLALIGARPFVARQKTTKLVVSANISPDSVHDGLHGDVFAIGGSFASTEGSAFFALAIGRRIDLRVRLR